MLRVFVFDPMLLQYSTKAQRLAVADDVLINDGDLRHLESQVAEAHRKYLQLAAKIAKANC